MDVVTFPPIATMKGLRGLVRLVDKGFDAIENTLKGTVMGFEKSTGLGKLVKRGYKRRGPSISHHHQS